MALQLPTVIFQRGRPSLNRPMSVSRFGERAIAFVEYSDPYWIIDMETQPMPETMLARFEAWLAQSRGGMETIHYVPPHLNVPQAYIGDTSNPVISDSGILSGINGNVLSVTGVSSGLKLMAGDLIGLSIADYNFIGRVVADVTAVGTSVSIAVEPFLPGYITIGATVTFKNPKLNTRILPSSINVGAGMYPTASFQLIEVPR